MIYNMDAMRNRFGQWLIVSIITSSTKENPDAEARFNELVNAPDYDSSKLDLKLMINGLTFDIMDDTFTAIEKHVEGEVEERAVASAMANKKMEALRLIMDMGTEELEEFLNGN